MKILIPSYVQTVLERLNARGHEAFAVGGCVRDTMDGREPSDWDVCTSALPGETKAAFSGFRVIETGIRHGTVTVLSEGRPVEITTYRVDGVYSDGRHPDSVSFTASLREDLARRDFTMNAMAFAPGTGVVDPFGGQEDLRRGLLRCVGDPSARFSEDALRILRALRFSAVYGYRIEPETAAAAHSLRQTLGAVSPERRLTELRKLLTGGEAAQVLAGFSDVLAAAVPGLGENTALDRAEAVGQAPRELDVRLGLLLRGLDAGTILRGLRAERALILRTEFLAGRLEQPVPSDRAGLRRLLRQAGLEAVRSLIRASNGSEARLDAILNEVENED